MQFDLHFVTDTQVKPLTTKGVKFVAEFENNWRDASQNARDKYRVATANGLNVSFETAAIRDEFTANSDTRIVEDSSPIGWQEN
jgi:hypothetical protein